MKNYREIRTSSNFLKYFTLFLALRISQATKEGPETAILLKRFLIIKHAKKINSKNVSFVIWIITLHRNVIVTNKDARIDILTKYSKYYLCLKGGHISKICKSSYLCRKCGGKHHISICKFDEKMITRKL